MRGHAPGPRRRQRLRIDIGGRARAPAGSIDSG